MNKSNVTNLIKTVKIGLGKHSPEILTGIGIAGMVTTTVLAVKSTPKALQLIDDKKMDVFDSLDPEDIPGNNTDYTYISLTPIEIIKAAWKPYIPAIVTGVASVTCLIGASSVNAKRNAALATAYELSKTALTEYKEKVVEEIGEKKEKIIREKVAQDRVDKTPINNSDVVVIGSGDVLFMEPICGKTFKSDIEYVRKVINDFNFRMTTGCEEYISLSEFYDEFKLKHTRASDLLGWNLGRDGQIKIDFLAAKTEDGKPCLMLDYIVEPRYDYSTLY